MKLSGKQPIFQGIPLGTLKDNRMRIGLVIMVGVVLIALLADVLSPYPSEGYGLVPPGANMRVLLPPSLSHPFGTDSVGRDVFSRVLIGSRYALLQVVSVVSASVIIGLMAGVIAAYYRGVLGSVIQYATELFMSVPSIVIALAIALAFGRGLGTVVISLILTWWSWYARIAFVYARSVVELEYVLLAKLSGLSSSKIIVRHVVRNVYQPVLVQAITDMGSVLLEATAINFLGLGLPPGSPEWGVIIFEGKDVLTAAPWISLFPGIFLLLTTVGFSLIGDSLRERIDPRLRKRWRLWF